MMDADLDIDAELGDGTFSIPQYSVSDQLQKVEEQGQDDIAVYNTAVHNMLRRYEYNYLKRRYKSFDLIQNEELCDRYYKDAMNMVQKDGLELATALTTSDQSALAAVRKLAQNFVNVYIPIKQKTQNVSYPWPTYDDDVQLSCLALMQQNEVAKCKAYMLGYLETVSRIPVADQSAQGKIFSNAIAWATGRHPYGSYFTKIVIALKSMLRRVRSELSSGEDLCSRIKMIIDQTTQMWLWSWSKFEAATLHLELSELLKECFQHIVFLAIPTLCQVFLHNSTYMSLHGDTNPFQRQNSSFAENTNTESEVTKGDSSAMLHSATTTTYRVVDPRLVDTNANLHAGSENVQLIIGSRKPAASQESDLRKPDSRVVTSHLPVVCETPEAVPVYDSANEMMYEGDIVLASATVVEDPVIPPVPSTIQAQVEASSAALYEAYNTFSSSYSSVLPPHVTPTTSVPTQSISRHAAPSIGFDRIIAVGELEEICGVPLRFRSLTLRRSGALTDISQSPFTKLFVDFQVLCHARTPGEVNDVALSIVDKIIQITSAFTLSSSVSTNAIDSTAVSSAKVGGPSASFDKVTPYDQSGPVTKTALSADDLIPLIGFSFALYFQSLRISSINTSTRTHTFRGTDRELMFALLRLADAFMLEHLLVRSTSYCLTSCYTALRALPPGV